MSNEATSSASRKCRSCGAPLAPDAPGSACWSCMIEAGTPATSGSGAANSAPTDDQRPTGHEAANGLAAQVVRRDELHESPSSGHGLTKVSPPTDEAVGQTIGSYKLREQLGEGGCG